MSNLAFLPAPVAPRAASSVIQADPDLWGCDHVKAHAMSGYCWECCRRMNDARIRKIMVQKRKERGLI